MGTDTALGVAAPEVPPDHFHMLVENILSATILTKDLQIGGDDPHAHDLRRALALIKTVVVLQESYPQPTNRLYSHQIRSRVTVEASRHDGSS